MQCSWIYWCRHDDVIKWKHFQRYWPFVRGIQQSPVTSPHKGQWGWWFETLSRPLWRHSNGKNALLFYSWYCDFAVISSSRYIATFKPFAFSAMVTPRRLKALLVFLLAYPFLLALVTTAVSHRWDPRFPCRVYTVYPPWAVSQAIE